MNIMKDSQLLEKWLDTTGVSVTALAKRLGKTRQTIYDQMDRKGGFSDDFKRLLEKNGIDINVKQPGVKIDTSEYDHWIQETLKSKDALISAKDMVIEEKDFRIKNLEDIITLLREKNASKNKIETKLDKIQITVEENAKVLVDNFKSQLGLLNKRG